VQKVTTQNAPEPVIHAHPGINPDDIDHDAFKVIRRLREKGVEAHVVGGCVRDLMCGKTPKDFDVITTATPKQIRRWFRNSRIIGRRFRLVHVFWGQKVIEVGTYRAPSQDETAQDPRTGDGDDGNFGDAASDAVLRDFTINALLYDPVEDQIIDYVGGFADLKAGVVRTINDPMVSFQEDPVRILRGIRYASSLQLEIEAETLRAMEANIELVAAGNSSRLREEIWKFLLTAGTADAFELMLDIGLFQLLFPGLEAWVEPAGNMLADLEEKDQLPRGRLDHGLLWAILFLGVLDELEDPADGDINQQFREIGNRFRDVQDPLAIRYDIPRRHRHDARYMIEQIPRLLRGPNGRHRRMAQQEDFLRSLDLYELYLRVRGLPTDSVREWQQARLELGPLPPGSKDRRRREGGRRRRRRRPRNHSQ